MSVGWGPPPVTEPQPPPPPEPTRRSPLVAVLAIVTVVALLAAGVGWFMYFDTKGDVDDLEADVEALQDENDQLQRDLNERGTSPDEGDGDTGDEGDPLDDLLDDELGGVGDLLGGGGTDAMMECIDSLDITGLLGGGDADIPDDDIDAQYDAVARWVEEERGLEFEEIPEPTYVTQEEMRERIGDQVDASYPEDAAQADEELLVALGVLEPGTDLLTEYSEFVGSSVAGYFDPETGELVVLADDDEPFDLLELTTIAHELEHTLADQALTLPIDDEPALHPDEDGQLAALSLVEGDATLTMTQFQLAAASLEDMLGALGDVGALTEQTEALEDAPPYFAQQMMFPYFEGLSFVCALHGDGGWDAVNEAYEKPPTTTAQIMFPERYLDGEEAVDVPDPESPGSGWEEVRRTTFGAAELMFLLDAVGIDEARTHAAEWAGGELGQWRRGEEVAVRISLADREGGGDLCQPLQEWADMLDDGTVTCDDGAIQVAVNA